MSSGAPQQQTSETVVVELERGEAEAVCIAAEQNFASTGPLEAEEAGVAKLRTALASDSQGGETVRCILCERDVPKAEAQYIDPPDPPESADQMHYSCAPGFGCRQPEQGEDGDWPDSIPLSRWLSSSGGPTSPRGMTRSCFTAAPSPTPPSSSVKSRPHSKGVELVGSEAKPKVIGSSVLLPDPSSSDGEGFMKWPNPYDPKELQYRLRYGPPLTRDELLVVASYLEAYQYLVTALPQHIRNQRCAELKDAVKGAPNE